MFLQYFIRLTNNRFINRLLIYTRLDAYVLSVLGMYKRVKPDKELSPQEMAGFSTRPEVQEAINKTHNDLKNVVGQYLKPGDHILDIGCGAGAYMIHFAGKYNITGLDLNKEMIETGKKHVPGATFVYGDFLKQIIKQKFNLIYSISVLEFVPPSRLNQFIKKISSHLLPGGILFLHYPHALNPKAMSYPDLYYIEYSPEIVAVNVTQCLTIVEHKHAYDGRTIADYDRNPYDPGKRTFKNGYLLIARKS